jgi:hypothetical protein
VASKNREAVRQGMGDVLGPSTDLLSQVLEGDRKRTGRAGAAQRSATHEDVARKIDSAVGNTTGSPETEATGNLVGSVALDITERPIQKPVAPPKPTGRRKEPAEPEQTTTTPHMAPANRLETALREMLANPYATDLLKGPYTVTSMKLHTEVSERLGWASTLLKRPKQDIVSEALRHYFERILREG